ncbi:MAG TPA: AAA family ATPase, partial [Beijerinckiaceae bacterium]|nr:AAA family ATPase [Beijerinckiaceae bacterium]
MKFDRLRIIGFKTFIDPTELVIETGLTGVVGPNGCGKSNLVEALRWVMGETSHKSMRASGMDDVIFSGSGQRPARNHAEVMLRVDNGAREAPAAFNDADFLEISRRIEREAGSTYRINGREVRARDVQLLFADAASGARSPSMVRQGQISEIISAKPQARRRILEDAAGIAGLHARRHDAELKLKAAEENLARVVDVLTHIDGQIDGLKRQARQAERYRTVAADIRRAEAVVRQREWHGASALVEQAGRQLDLDTRAVASAMTEQGEAERQRAVAQHAIAPLRQEEAKAGELLQRLVIAREALDGEERRAKSRQEELDRRIAELARDLERARRMCDDATAALTRLTSEQTLLSAESGGSDAEPQARERLSSAEAEVQQAEATLQEIQTALAEATARRSVAESGLAEANARLARLKPQLAETERQAAQLAASASGAPDLEVLRASVSAAAAALESSEAGAQQAEVAHLAVDLLARHARFHRAAQVFGID